MKSNSQRCWQRLDNYATKDVLVLSLCFLLLFTAYNGLQYLQSSLHTEAGLGLATISVLYGSLAAANLMGLASVGISQIGHKWTMVVCMSTYLMWVLMNGHATWYTMIPSAVLVGLGAGPLWVAAAAYLTVTASSVACKGREQMQVIIHRYFGILYFMFSLGRSYDSWGPFSLAEIRKWFNTYVHKSMWDVLAYPCRSFTGGLVRAWMSNCIPCIYVYVINQPSRSLSLALLGCPLVH